MKARALIFGYSWVGILNQLLLQWLFVRLQVEMENASDRTILGVANFSSRFNSARLIMTSFPLR